MIYQDEACFTFVKQELQQVNKTCAVCNFVREARDKARYEASDSHL